MSWRIPQYVTLEGYADYDNLPDLSTMRFFEIDFRREYLVITNQLVWQYKPWPGADWVTYFAVNIEDMLDKTGMAKSIFSAVYNQQAAKILAGRRFYKVERVDTQSQGTKETGRGNRQAAKYELGRGPAKQS